MGKLTQCKVCNSKYVKQINAMLKECVPYKIIANYLAERKLIISTTSIGRHNQNHVKGQKKDRLINKGKIRKVKEQVNKNLSKQSQEIQTIVNIDTGLKGAPAKVYKHYLSKLNKFQEDFDVIAELQYTMAVAKERMDRAIQEELTSDMVLQTTAVAIKDYGKLVKDFNDIMQGSASIQQLRFAQLVNMITMLFMKRPLTDATRYQLLQLSEANPIAH